MPDRSIPASPSRAGKSRLPPLVLGVSLLLGGCYYDSTVRWKSAPKTAVSVTLEYRVRPGDRVQVTFLRHLEDSASSAYLLQRGDEVRLSVQDRDDLSCVSAVAPDGNLYLPYLDALKAEGRTLAELRRLAEEKYQPLVQSARVTLVPVRLAALVSALMQDLSTPGRPGSTYEAQVTLDGQTAFPHLGYLPMAGLTPQEASRLLKEKYASRLPGVEIMVGVQGGASRLVTVLGEMRRPGSFPVDGSVSLTTAMGLAEGWIPSACLTDIVLVRRLGDKMVISKHNLHVDLLSATQLQLAGGDLVFVPRTAITDLNVFVDQYIRRNIPIPIGFTIPVPSF